MQSAYFYINTQRSSTHLETTEHCTRDIKDESTQHDSHCRTFQVMYTYTCMHTVNVKYMYTCMYRCAPPPPPPPPPSPAHTGAGQAVSAAGQGRLRAGAAPIPIDSPFLRSPSYVRRWLVSLAGGRPVPRLAGPSQSPGRGCGTCC